MVTQIEGNKNILHPEKEELNDLIKYFTESEAVDVKRMVQHAEEGKRVFANGKEITDYLKLFQIIQEKKADEGPRYGGASDLQHTAYCNGTRMGHPNSKSVCFCDCDYDAGPRYKSSRLL